MSANNFGIPGYNAGAIFDQTLLLQDIRDGLEVYNAQPDAIVEGLSEMTIREVLRVSQGPKKFGRMADGGNAENSKMLYRLVSTPLNNYDLSSEFTMLWLQDALPSDVDNELRGAIAGDAQLVNALLFEAIFTKRTASAVGTASRTSFYNGETDVPQFKNNAFSSAHYHYLGANETTLSLTTWRLMKKDIQEHGYGLTPGSLHAWINTAQIPDVMAFANSNASTTILQAWTPERQKAIDGGLFGTGVVIEGVMVHVDDNVPSGYVAMLANDVKPLARRVHIQPAYQGLQEFREAPNEQYPLLGMKFVRRVGFSAQHLGAGTARQIVASTTYTNPTLSLAV